MQKSISVSIIICTRNRADSLKQTLASMRNLYVPPEFTVELLVVDSNSTDHTSAVIESFEIKGMTLHHLHEARHGKSIATNSALSQAKGDIILSTDDDVRPPRNWIELMCQPIVSGGADAVAGGVRLAPHLEQFKLSSFHKSWLACTEPLTKQGTIYLVGANMAYSREILKKIPQFDPELGPGATGHADDTLFSLQVDQAGFRIVSRWNVEVEHHVDPSRFTRRAFRELAAKRGEFNAYVDHHWHHYLPWKLPLLRPLLAALNLLWWRLKNWRESFFSDQAPAGELLRWEQLYYFRHYLKEYKRPRNYAKKGLIKLQ